MNVQTCTCNPNDFLLDDGITCESIHSVACGSNHICPLGTWIENYPATCSTPKICTLNCIRGYHQVQDSSGNCSCVPSGINISVPPPPISDCNLDCISGYVLNTDSSGNCYCVPSDINIACAFLCPPGTHHKTDMCSPCIPISVSLDLQSVNGDRSLSQEPIECNLNCIIGYTSTFDTSGNCTCVPTSTSRGTEEQSKSGSSQFVPQPCTMMCKSNAIYGRDSLGNCICVPVSTNSSSNTLGVSTYNNEVYYIIGFVSLIIIFLIIYYFMTKG